MRIRQTGVATVLVIGVALLPLAGPATAQPTTASTLPRIERDLNLAVVGMVVRDDGTSLAIIEDRSTKKTGVYKLGASLKGGRVTAILPDQVIIAFPDGEVALKLAASAGAGAPTPSPAAERPAPDALTLGTVPPGPVEIGSPPPSGPRFQTVERNLAVSLSLGYELAAEVTVVPDVGVKIEKVGPSGLFHLLGLRKGDVIRRVNAEVPGASAPLERVVEEAMKQQVVRVEFERSGKTDRIYLQIQP